MHDYDFVIPDTQKDALTTLVSLNDEEVQNLIGVISTASAQITGRRDVGASGELVANLPAFDSGTGVALTEAALAALGTKSSRGWSIERVVAEVRARLDLSKEQGEVFEERFDKLLRTPALYTVAKVADVLSEHQNGYHGARVVTDLRPVYGEAVDERPLGAVIVHTLKVQYHEARGRIRSLYIGMDAEDIKDLCEVLDRALDKAQSLERSAGLTILTLGGEPSE